MLAERGGTVGPPEPPTADGEALVTYLSDVSRALRHATNQEKRSVARYLLDGMTLDPHTRQIEIGVKLPANAFRRVGVGARTRLAAGGAKTGSGRKGQETLRQGPGKQASLDCARDRLWPTG